MKIFLMKIATPLILLTAFLSTSVLAGTYDYVFLPNVEVGESELDLKFRTGAPANADRRSVSIVGFGYGVTESWFTQIYLERLVTGRTSDITVAEWENKFQLLETGKYPFELGVITEIEAPLTASAPWEVRVGPLLQTEFGKVQLNGNVVLERRFSSDNSGIQYATEVLYQWQIKYRLQEDLEFGAQGYGDLGASESLLDSTREGGRRVGPAVFGKVALDGHKAIRYNAAWLIGAGATAPERTFKFQVEYDF